MKKVFLSIVLLVCLFSCDKEDNVSLTKGHEDPALLEYLSCQGFDTSKVVVMDEFINIEEDILINKNQIYEMMTTSSNILDLSYINKESLMTRQYANSLGTLVSMTNVQNIKFYIDNSVEKIPSLGANWVSSIVSACSEWTAILDCRISYTRVYSHAEANVSFFADNVGDPLPLGMRNMDKDKFVAKACFPFNGSVGRFISINDYKYNYNLSQLIMSVKHELGHTLGLRHDNVTSGSYTDDCGHSYPNPTLITGTPQNDNNSIMVAAVNTNSFSSLDLTAIKYLYPENYNSPVINNIINVTNDGNVRIQIATPSGQLPYRAIVQRLNLAGNVVATTEFLNPGTKTNFDVPCPNGIWKFRMLYTNYGTWGSVSNSYVICQGLCRLKRKNSNKCLDAANCGTGNGTNVQVWEDNGQPCQRWIMTLESDGYYELKMQNSPTRNLDAAACGTGNGTNIQLWDDYNNDCQRWKLSLESDGNFELKRKGALTKNLDVSSCDTNVQLYDDLNNDCQRWQITVY